MTVHATILEQLGGNRFRVMTGAKDFVSAGNGLSFRIGRNAKRVSHARITLRADDTYKVEFLRYSARHGLQTLAVCEQVYADRLQATFTAETGLDTHL